MTVQEGVLVWPFVSLCDMNTTTPPLTSGQQQQVIAQAVEWLWSRSARRFGTRAVVYRPQSRIRGIRPWPGIGLQPVDSTVSGLGTGWGEGEWSPEHDRVLELAGPVVSVESVQIEGATVDQAVWRVEGNYLVRQDGGTWPRTQNMISALGAADTWAVNYTRGYQVTDFGKYATGRLICYFAKQLAGGQPCVLPMNTSSVSRGGVTIQRETGKGKAAQTSPVPEVDQWLAMVNPNGLMSEPVIWSPDVDRARWPFEGSYLASAVPQGMSIGDISALADFLVLSPTDPVPAGTPAGTVIFRSE